MLTLYWQTPVSVLKTGFYIVCLIPCILYEEIASKGWLSIFRSASCRDALFVLNLPSLNTECFQYLTFCHHKCVRQYIHWLSLTASAYVILSIVIFSSPDISSPRKHLLTRWRACAYHLMSDEFWIKSKVDPIKWTSQPNWSGFSRET